jgi:hypothetical protein
VEHKQGNGQATPPSKTSAQKKPAAEAGSEAAKVRKDVCVAYESMEN